MGLYFDFVFSPVSDPGQQGMADLLTAEGYEEHDRWSKADKNGIEHTNWDFVNWSGAPGMVTVFDTPYSLEDGNIRRAHIRLSWATDALSDVMKYLIGLGERCGFTVYSDQYITRDNLEGYVTDLTKRMKKIVEHFGRIK